MSKFLAIKYRDKIDEHQEGIIRKTLNNIAVDNIRNDFSFMKSSLNQNFYIGIVNVVEPLEDKGQITLGQKFNYDSSSEGLPDGSFFEINYTDKEISFYCDRFESKTLWYYFDDEKIILSNSQRAIISLKSSFNLNEEAVSWFLSSGSLGYKNSWDKDITKVSHSCRYVFDSLSWELRVENKEYLTRDFNFESVEEFDKIFLSLTQENFTNILSDKKVEQLILPLSGGNDSRLLYSIALQNDELKKITIANWGVKGKYDFNDKVAAQKIAAYHKTELMDAYLPDLLSDPDEFLDLYIKNTDCRIDHFNAFSDHFDIFKKIYEKDFKIIVRGDIPFTEGLDLDEKMSRAHIGIPCFKDFSNCTDYELGKFITIQEKSIPKIERKKDETLIQWRDRLYIDFRIPIVISAFNDMINGYIELRAPMMSFSHYKLYEKLNDSNKGDKKHIVRLSSKLNYSKIPFNARPSIPSSHGLFLIEENLNYLTASLRESENNIFSETLINQLTAELVGVTQKIAPKQTLKYQLKNFLKEHLPMKLKAKLKSKTKQELNPVTLAYRILLINKTISIFTTASENLKK